MKNEKKEVCKISFCKLAVVFQRGSDWGNDKNSLRILNLKTNLSHEKKTTFILDFLLKIVQKPNHLPYTYDIVFFISGTITTKAVSGFNYEKLVCSVENIQKIFCLYITHALWIDLRLICISQTLKMHSAQGKIPVYRNRDPKLAQNIDWGHRWWGCEFSVEPMHRALMRLIGHNNTYVAKKNYLIKCFLHIFQKQSKVRGQFHPRNALDNTLVKNNHFVSSAKQKRSQNCSNGLMGFSLAMIRRYPIPYAE